MSTRRKATDFPKEVLALFDGYVHGRIERRDFLEGANHGFHNDTTPRYDEGAGTLARERTIAFFNEHLRG